MYNDLLFCGLDADEFVKQLIENRKKSEKMNETNAVTIEKEKLEVGLAQRNVFEITKVYFDLLTSGKIKSDVDTTDVIRMIITLSNVFEFNNRDLNENDEDYESTIREFATRKLLDFYGKDEVEEEKLKFVTALVNAIDNGDSIYWINVEFDKKNKYKVDYLEVHDVNHSDPIFKITIENCK